MLTNATLWVPLMLSLPTSDAEINPEPDPLSQDNYGPYLPDMDDGPVTTALEIEIAPENHIRFFRLMKQIRLVFLRNGACRD